MSLFGTVLVAGTVLAAGATQVSSPPPGLVLSHSEEKTLYASWLDGAPALALSETKLAGGILPLTVVNSELLGIAKVNCSWVKDQIETFEKADDVFSKDFLEYIYLQGPTDYEEGLAECLNEAFGTTTVLSCNPSSETVQITATGSIPSGPYVAYVSSLSVTLGQVFRVYHDVYQAFMSGSLPSTNNSFVTAPVNALSDATQGIPVPSRIYTLDASDEKPFSGLRIGVKDIIDIKGLRTSMGNRAWFDIYDKADENAPSIETLLDLGASIVGKTKTAQFANNDRPTADWVDYHDAFNARGDGYQDPGASSAGSGAAIGAYDWLDIAIGTDTGGSVRIPASKNGVYGLRPTFDSVSAQGVLPEGPYFDAVGYHARDPYLLQSFGKKWIGDKYTSYPSFPKTLHVPNDLFPVADSTAQGIYDDFLGKLSTFLGNATIDNRNASELWSLNSTEPGHDQSFFSYLHETGFNLEWKYQYDHVFAPFYEKYSAKYDGRVPFLNPTVASRINFYKNQSSDAFDEAKVRQEQFKTFFNDDVLGADEESCSSGLWVTPSNPGTVSYINSFPIAAPVVNTTALTFAMWYYSSFSGAPEIVIPIGQLPYNSTISGVQEYLPVTVDLIARPGCDYMLLDLTAKLADAGLVKKVNAGRTMW